MLQPRDLRSLGAVAPFGQGFIAVGSVYDAGDADPVIVLSPDGLGYVGETPAHSGRGIQRYNDVCVSHDRTAVAVGVGGSTGAFDVIVGARTEGSGWAKGEGTFTGDGNQQGYACAASDDGFVLVGSDDRSGNVDARVSSSGDISRRDRGEPALAGPGEQSVSNISIDGDGHVTLVGDDYGRVGLWESDTLDR